MRKSLVTIIESFQGMALHKKITVSALFLAIIALPVFLIGTTMQHNTQQHAGGFQGSAVLLFSPSVQEVQSGQTITEDVYLDPVQDKASFVKLDVQYDPTKLKFVSLTPIDPFVELSNTTPGITVTPPSVTPPGHGSIFCGGAVCKSGQVCPMYYVQCPTTGYSCQKNTDQNAHLDTVCYPTSPTPSSVDCSVCLSQNMQFLCNTQLATPGAAGSYCSSSQPNPNSGSSISCTACQATPRPTCIPRPACLDTTPRCLPPEPIGGWCQPTGTPTPIPMHCGGNMQNAPQCPGGYSCLPDPNSHLPFGDVGGICKKECNTDQECDTGNVCDKGSYHGIDSAMQPGFCTPITPVASPSPVLGVSTKSIAQAMITPIHRCVNPPPCIYANPACQIAQPASGWCQPTPTGEPVANPLTDTIFSLGIGSDSTKVITTKTKIATVTFIVIDPLYYSLPGVGLLMPPQIHTKISFGKETVVLALTTDSPGSNILKSSEDATVTINSGPQPSPTFGPDAEVLNLSLTTSAVDKNTTVVQGEKKATVTFFDQNNAKQGESAVPVFYTSDTSAFTGSIDISSLHLSTNTSFLIKVALPGSLRKQIPGFFAIHPGKNMLPQVSLISGDINADNVIDILDYNIISDCFDTKEASAPCLAHAEHQNADLNYDGVIDGVDYNIFLRSIKTHGGD